MPLWIGAYLADTMKFTTIQHGAYMLLLMAYWRDRAPLKDDDDELRGIAKADRSEWKKLRPVLAGKFRVADGVWWHKRVELELADAIRRKTAAVGKAQAAAQARWGKEGKQAASSASRNAPSTAQALHEECPTSTPTPTPKQEDQRKTARKRAPAVPVPIPDGVDESVFRDWLALRKAKNAPVTPTVIHGALGEAEKAGLSLEAFLRIWCHRGTQGLQAEWLKPNERGNVVQPPEPAWRTEQRVNPSGG